MKKKLISRTTFICKSLAWSVLFYFTAMVIINWEEYSMESKDKSWVIKKGQGEGKELIPVKVMIDDKITPLGRIMEEIDKYF